MSRASTEAPDENVVSLEETLWMEKEQTNYFFMINVGDE